MYFSRVFFSDWLRIFLGGIILCPSFKFFFLLFPTPSRFNVVPFFPFVSNCYDEKIMRKEKKAIVRRKARIVGNRKEAGKYNKISLLLL